MKLVDTDIFIDFFRGVEAAQTFFLEHAGEILFSALTEAELLSGKECNNPEKREKILHFLSQFEKIPVDNPLVQTAGDFRRRYGLHLPDALIASSAFLSEATLITRNIEDFQKIPLLKIQKPF